MRAMPDLDFEDPMARALGSGRREVDFGQLGTLHLEVTA
jgi:hypothetical protein